MIGDVIAQALDCEALSPVIRRVLGSETATVTTWEIGKLSHQPVWQNTGGLYRLSGTALDGGAEQPWSVVLKVVRGPVGASLLDNVDREPGSPVYWKREPELLRDGVLDDVRGDFIPPRCYGVDEPDDDTALIWLEEVVEVDAKNWPLARYGVAARHLGQFNGRYIVGEPIPHHRSFCPSWVRKQRSRDRARGEIFPPPEVWDEPAVRDVYPPAVAERFARLWDEEHLFLDILDRLPVTFCHRDAFRNNLMARGTKDGREQTVAIDWALAGPGHLGEDLFKFVGGSELFLRTDFAVRELDEVAFENYVAGLRDVGWTGDRRVARLGFAATVVMGNAAGFALPPLRDPDFLSRVASTFGKSPREVGERRIQLMYYALDLADEARHLIAQDIA